MRFCFRLLLPFPDISPQERDKGESEDVSMWPFVLQLQEREAGSRNEITSVFIVSMFFGGELIKNSADLQRVLITGSGSLCFF